MKNLSIKMLIKIITTALGFAITCAYADTYNHDKQKAQCFFDVKAAYAHLKQNQHDKANHPININTASASELMTLKGVGVKTAEAIVFYREHMGDFQSVDDLTRVKGIGQKTVDNNRHRLRVK